MPGVARASPISTRAKTGFAGVRGRPSNQLFVYVMLSLQKLARRATFNGFSGKRCFVTKINVNNISDTISVLPILREHGQFSAILERTQSNHSDCRHWIEGVSTMKPGTESFFFNT